MSNQLLAILQDRPRALACGVVLQPGAVVRVLPARLHAPYLLDHIIHLVPLAREHDAHGLQQHPHLLQCTAALYYTSQLAQTMQ